MIAEQDGKVAVLFGECPVRPAPLPAGKRVEFGVGSFEDEVRKAAERGFTVEIDDQGEPKDEWARLELKLAVAGEPRSALRLLAQELLKVSAPFRLGLVERMQHEVELIAEDMDEHDTPFDDERPPDVGRVAAWRGFLSALKSRLAAGAPVSAAELRFRPS